MKTQENILHNLLRADLYRILALGFDQPTHENLETLERILSDLLIDWLEYETGEELKTFLKRLRFKFSEKEWNLVDQEYHRLFTTQVFCPPSEGSYQAVERGPILGDITAFYEAFQMKVLPRQGPPDGLKMELGFMSFMALKEAYAQEKGLAEEAQTTHEASGKFLKDHLGRWVPLFAGRLCANSSHPFYLTLTQTLKVWMDQECHHFQVIPALLLPGFDQSSEESMKCAM